MAGFTASRVPRSKAPALLRAARQAPACHRDHGRTHSVAPRLDDFGVAFTWDWRPRL
jgi:hypothetical protein